MTKGLLILVIVFTVIAILNFFSIRMMKIDESKKSNYRKILY